MKQLNFLFFQLFFALICFFSCTQSFMSKGEIAMKAGDDKKVLVRYEIDSLAEFTSKYLKEDLINISEQLSKEAENRCNYPLTYEPKLINVYFMDGVLTARLEYIAKNAFGTPGKGSIYGTYKGTVLVEAL